MYLLGSHHIYSILFIDIFISLASSVLTRPTLHVPKSSLVGVELYVEAELSLSII